MNFDGKRLTDRDMKIVVDQAIVEKQCRGLSLQNNELTSQGISTLAMGICESTMLEELNLSNNRLSDEDLLPLARELSVIGATTVEKWNFFGIANAKVSEWY
jgi:Ran GTPase-activating protein (RanGAP) involved in mRNA processing and transport